METNNFSEEYNKLWNSYFYPGTKVFVNKMNIMNEEELYQYETNLVNTKLQELHNNPITGDFDIKHLCEIHKYLFGDLYDWAGKYRDVYMKKQDGSLFAKVDEIEMFLEDDIRVMKENMKYVYNKDTLANLITDSYIALLNTHPFREGNGRSIREFLREYVVNKTELAWGIAYDINWNLVNHKLVDELISFGRAYSGPIRLEILKAIVPYNKDNVIKK